MKQVCQKSSQKLAFKCKSNLSLTRFVSLEPIHHVNVELIARHQFYKTHDSTPSKKSDHTTFTYILSFGVSSLLFEQRVND